MTSHPQPKSGAIVEMTAADGPVSDVRVVHADGAVLTLSLALSAIPPEGAAITVRWPGGDRGRYAQDALVIKIDENRVDVRMTGDTRIEQQRNFVRGGGGESAILCRTGEPDAVGMIRDISEQGVRAYFTDVKLTDGDVFTLRVKLKPDMIEMTATVAKVESLRQTVPHDGGSTSVEIVAVLNADEIQAKAIRRYVLRQQLQARNAG
jgi:hypothetical protein